MKEKKMFRVEYKTLVNNDDPWSLVPVIDDMKQWCKEQFGANPSGKGHTKIWWCTRKWCSSWDKSDPYDDGFYYPAFYFATEKQLAWFRLRWG